MRTWKCISVWMAAAFILTLGPSALTWAAQPESSCALPAWVQTGDNWYWMKEDGRVYAGWLDNQGRTYYLDETGKMVTGWKKIEDEWYYFHEDGGMNLGELTLEQAVYRFSATGALTSARWKENSGGGSYPAGCYGEEEQALFDTLSEEKKAQYFDTYPDREDEYDGDMHTSYDRNAGFQVDVRLNKIAAHRLSLAMESGYMDSRIPGEGTIQDYLSSISYRSSASCLEVYVRSCEDAEEAYDKVMEKTDRKYGSGQDRGYTLLYYRYMGMAHCEKDSRHWFVILLMR